MSSLLTTSQEEKCFSFTLRIMDMRDALLDISRLSLELTPFFSSAGVTPDTAASLHIALEELLTNLAKFARTSLTADEAEKNTDATELRVDGKITIEADQVILEISDNGVPFDPSRLPSPDLTDDPLERMIGGLGVHMLFQMFSDFRYHFKDGKNVGLWRLKVNS